MPRRNEEIERPKLEMRVYTEDELKRFDQKIQKFYEEYTLTSGEKIIKVLNKNRIAIAYGAMVFGEHLGRKYYAVIKDELEDTKRYNEFENLMGQWDKWKNKKEYINKKEVEHYEQLVEQKHLITN